MPAWEPEPEESSDPGRFTYSIVVPVYNSVDVVGTTIDRITEAGDDGMSGWWRAEAAA